MKTETAISTVIMSAAVSITASTGVEAYPLNNFVVPHYVIGRSSQVAQTLDATIAPQLQFWPEATDRLEFLSTLDDDHDGEGAKAPNSASIKIALAFLHQLDFYAPDPLVGLTHDGNAVIEFHDNDELGQVIFYPDRTAEVYSARAHRPSISFEGSIDNPSFTTRFNYTFGFRFAA